MIQEKEMAGLERARRIVTASIASPEDRTCLLRTLAMPRWRIQFAGSLAALRRDVITSSSGIVITDQHLADGSSWKDVLANLDRHRNRPQLIVADRLADEALWAEVLNLGGYDLLVSPFDPAELHRSVSLAWEFHAREIARKGVDHQPTLRESETR
jgi:DNA-binding response OmpR family regulator